MRALAFALVATSAMSPALAASAVDPAILRQAQDWSSSPAGEITSLIVNGKTFTEADFAANPYLASAVVKAQDAEREAEIRRLRVLVLETRTAPTK